ncbi:MAG: NAD(P)-dependent oxidoreductase [Candidatus Aureabacteria bacterium]|nr:NAD(P)-dependent oxidoreductase [Candidatus Auribacterota bacterium]
MNILIAGNAGFIGGYLTRKLISLGHNITGLDINPDNPQSKLCKCVAGDICDREAVMGVMKDIDLVINLAAKHHDFGISEKEYFEVNEGGTKNLLECAAQFDIKKFVFYSSAAVYGSHKTSPTEETIPNFPSPYGRSKLAGEKALANWAKEDSERKALVIRPVVVFGPENYANMYSLIKQIADRKFVFIGKGDNIKAIVYIENLIEATVFLLNHLEKGIDYFNYVDGPQMTSKQIANIISQYAGIDTPKIHFPFAMAMALAFPCDILEKITGRLFPITAKRIKKFNTETSFNADKIRKAGFKQPLSLEEGFKRTLEWFKKLPQEKLKRGENDNEL